MEKLTNSERTLLTKIVSERKKELKALKKGIEKTGNPAKIDIEQLNWDLIDLERIEDKLLF